MRITERDYDPFAEDHFPNMVLLRALASCSIWLAGVDGYLIVLVDNAKKKVAIIEYDSESERDKVIQINCKLPEDEGGAGARVPAVRGPEPPSLSARASQSLPPDEIRNE